MKCPHCGMNIRDNVVVCGYCDGKIEKGSEKSTQGAGKPNSSGGTAAQKGDKVTKKQEEEPGTDEEEEGGLSVYLQPGEQVLIGSLNIAVKKFFFHAYLTNQRVFLIDTQEKKVRVTAKDISRDTIVGSIIEFSENSDPVLVLSHKSVDEEIKTLKLIFVQNGMDRSPEIDEWINLLHDKEKPKKSSSHPVEEVPKEKEVSSPVEPEKPVQKQELTPKRKPAKDPEKQPPVKRHFSIVKTQPEEPKPEEPAKPPRRGLVREVPEPVKKPAVEQESDREIPPVRKANAQPARKHEVQSAMKVAMKSAMQPLRQSSSQSVKRPVIESVSPPLREPEPEGEKSPSYRPRVQEKVKETPVPDIPSQDEGTEIPPFCHNCGKKMPQAANFCPGCGTKMSPPKAPAGESPSIPEKKVTHHEAPVREKKVSSRDQETDEEEREDETPVATKLPAKKGPKGNEMTILHKFLRR